MKWGGGGCYRQESWRPAPISQPPCSKCKILSFWDGATLDPLEPKHQGRPVTKPRLDDVPHKTELQKLERELVMLQVQLQNVSVGVQPHAADPPCKSDSWVKMCPADPCWGGWQSPSQSWYSSPGGKRRAKMANSSSLATIPTSPTTPGHRGRLTKHGLTIKLVVLPIPGHQNSRLQVCLGWM